MAVQNPFFGKRETEPFQPRSTSPSSVLGAASGQGAASAQPVASPAVPKSAAAESENVFAERPLILSEACAPEDFTRRDINEPERAAHRSRRLRAKLRAVELGVVAQDSAEHPLNTEIAPDVHGLLTGGAQTRKQGFATLEPAAPNFSTSDGRQIRVTSRAPGKTNAGP